MQKEDEAERPGSAYKRPGSAYKRSDSALKRMNDEEIATYENF